MTVRATPPEVRVSGSAAFFDEQSWPRPCARLDALDHRLRYGVPSREDLRVAATVVTAYRALIEKPRRTRERVVACLRRAMAFR